MDWRNEDGDFGSKYYTYRLLTSYLLPPGIAIWGVYSAIKMEMNLPGDIVLTGAPAILVGLLMVPLALGLLILLSWRDQWLRNLINRKHDD